MYIGLHKTNSVKKYFLWGCLATMVFLVVFTFEREKTGFLYSAYSDVDKAITALEELSTSWQNQPGYIFKELTSHILSNRLLVNVPRKFCKERTSLVIIVASAPGDFERRRTIRETWGSVRNVSNFLVDVYFMVGRSLNKTLQKKIEKEYRKHDDVIQEEVVDTYRNLTAKSLMMLKVTEIYCGHRTEYFMKTDDDMFVNMVPLRHALINRKSKSDLLLGHKYYNPEPKRSPVNKWYVPTNVYSAKRYPDFVSGSGYVMSIDVVQRLYQTASQIPLYFLEDVYITGMLARFAGVIPQDDPRFHPDKQEPDPCLFKSIITAHNYTRKEMTELYEGIKTKKC